ncbi:uncharacterized protein ppp1r3ab [Pangasianodon hypophthalmus]|uniref:uncharacterized protein ppp1r3ab n=1 Tax=Pangasianodon hypophthalmus TaxID=310915 RepID=UPI00230745E0|nr:uncharacterized protein ppp1r3ab [Pangasianodon hypophthalmus]
MSNMMSQHVAYQLFASRLANSHSTTDSPHGLMEPVEGELQGLNVGSSNLLGLPETCPWDSDDELLGIGGIKPKSSPIPRRRSSLSCSDDEAQPPPSSSRRVSFADAFGLSLVSVKQFDTWSMCDPSDPLEIDPKDAKEYYLELLFALPLTLEELLYRVQEQKVNLESLELLPGTTTLKGTVRVLNLCFDKLVYIRTSLDCWSSHFDLLAEYVPESSQGVTDCFSFKLTLVPPFGEQGERVDFCIRYETPFGTFWANNSGQNYVLFCHEKAKDQDENEKLKPKSCLKPSRHSSTTSTTSNAEEIPEIILNCGIAAVTEPVGVKEEKLQEEHMNLKEENSKNCSRRKRRKAARMAKLQQYFAQRDGKDLQQIETDTDEVDVPVPAIDEAPLNLSSPQTNVSSLLAEPRNTEGQKSIAGSMDVEKNQVPDAQTQTEERDNIPVIHPELITSKSQTRQPPLDSVNSHKSVVDSQLLESSQDEETVTSQSVSHKCQTSDKSIVKTVEKAWECFEKCAMEKMGSTADTNSSVDKTNHVDNTLLENNQGTWSFGHHYTFETIVAPLYHQVFERMENDRRGVKNSTSKADESAGKIDDGSLSVVTYPRVATRSNPEISAKHVNDDDYHGACKETFPEHLHNTKSASENALSVPNVKTKLVAEIAFQDTALPDITDNLLGANISESKTTQVVVPIETQHSSNSQPSVSWEESSIDQTEQTPEMIILQSECLDDTEYSLDNKHPYSGYSLNTTIQQELMCIDHAILPTQSEVDVTAAKPAPAIVSENPQSEDRSVTQTSTETQISNEINNTQDKEAQTSEQTLNTGIKCLEESYTPMPDPTLFHSDISSNVQSEVDVTAAKPSPVIVSENPKSEDRSVTQTSFETRISDEINNTQDKEAQTSEQTLNTGIKCLEESYTPMPDPTLFHSDISLNVTPKMIQSDAPSPSQDLTQVTIQPQIPATNLFTQSLEVTGATVPQLQTTDYTNLIQKTTNTCQNSDSSHHVESGESYPSDRNDGVDSWEEMENETFQTEILHMSPEDTAEDRNFIDVSQINKNKGHRSSHFSFPDEVTDFDDLLVKDMAMSNISSNPENPEDASQEEEEIKENDQVKNPDNNEEQELTDMTENQSEEVKEIREVEKQIEEKEEQEDNKQEDQVEKEQENDEKVELGIEDKFKDGSYYPEDDKEEVKKDEKEKDAEPRRNGVEWEALETEIEEQEMDGGVTSVATLQSIPNIDSFIRDVHLHVGQEQQNTGLEQTSEEPVSERHSTGEEEESFCGKDSSQQALTLSSDVAFSDQVEEIENISEFVDQEEDVCCQIDEEHVVEDAIGEVDAVPEKQERDCVNEQSENMDDSASTESLTDDEMELYLLRLKNIEQSGLKDAISMGKRHSISRTWTIPSPMPSISEYIDEDQPNALLDDLTNEEMIELERAALPLLDEEQEVTEPNLLWWREFFSSDNMPKMILYTLLFVVFLITTYICDFIACFGLYLLALYWLYFQVQREPLKGT